MPREAKGEVRWSADGAAARVTLKGRDRKTFPLPTCKTEAEADERAALLASLALRFRKAGVIDRPEAEKLLEMAANATKALLPGVIQVAGELVGGEIEADGNAPKKPTFRELRKQWTSGELRKLYPDHVKAKDSDTDAARAEKMEALDVGGMALGDIPVDRFTLDHADAVLRQLPAEARRPATRRHYAQIIHRVMALAVYPCRHIVASPLPRGWLPKIGDAIAKQYLYPDEDALLMAAADVPLALKMFFGVLAREGARASEIGALRLGVDIDLDRGVVRLDENKTDDPRAWALDPGVVLALRAWCKLRGVEPGELVFVDEFGRPLEADAMADTFRRCLRKAGVQRPELFETTKKRRQIRVHDLRATFVTVSLATGKTEGWISDRTGHRSSIMINRYRRVARTMAELGTKPLLPLDEAIPELSNSPALPQRHTRPLGGTAYAADLKSAALTGIRVRVPEGLPASTCYPWRQTTWILPLACGSYFQLTTSQGPAEWSGGDNSMYATDSASA